MKIIFKTNLDHYPSHYFPSNITIPPRIGEKILVRSGLASLYINKHLPNRLEVCDVIWTEDFVICELWYNAQDLEIAKASGGNPF